MNEILQLIGNYGSLTVLAGCLLIAAKAIFDKFMKIYDEQKETIKTCMAVIEAQHKSIVEQVEVLKDITNLQEKISDRLYDIEKKLESNK